MTRTAFRRWALLVFACAVFSPLAAAQDLPAGIRFIRSLGGISEYQLDNGLQLLLMPAAGQPQTRVSITYRVGSRHEGAGEAGMAHLLEHVTFRGTAGVADLGAEMQKLSASFNGTTSLDRTNYIDIFPSGEPVTLRRVLKLEAERMLDARLAPMDFDKEKPIVLNEMGLRASATAAQMQQAMMAAAFRQHPYGRPVIGFTADIEQLSLPTLRRFYERHYRPDNASLMLAGGFEPAQALAAVAESFGALPQQIAPLAVAVPAEPAQAGTRQMTVHTRETALALAWRIPGLAHPQAAALQVLREMLSHVPSQLTSFDPARPVQLTHAGNGLTRDPFLLGLIVQSPSQPSDDAKARDALASLEDQWISRLEQPRRLTENGGLVRRMADDVATRLRKSLQEPASASALIADAVGAGDWRLPFKLLDELGRVTPEQVYDVAGLYLRAENRIVVRGVTDPSVQAAEFKELGLSGFASLFSKPVEVAGVSDPSAGLGEIKPLPAVAAGDAFVTDPVLLDQATRRYLLPSGLLLGVLSKNSAAERVTMQINLRWARPVDVAQRQGWRVLGGLVQDGSAGRSAEQIKQAKKGLDAEIRVISGPQQLTVALSAKKATLLPALLLVKEMLSEPTLPEDAFRREQNQALARLASAARSPGTAALEQERQHHMRQQGLQPGMPGYQPSVAELTEIWRELRVEDARDFQRRFWSGNQALVSVVGPVPDKLMAAVESFIGEWKKSYAPAFERLVLAHTPEPAARFATPSASVGQAGAAVVSMHQELALNRYAPDFFALLIGSRILAGGGGASSTGGNRLADRLRGQDALSYNVNALLRVPGEGDRAALRLQATGAPTAAARVEAAMKAEIERLLVDGVSTAEVDQARHQLQVEHRQALSSDAGLAAALLNQLDRSTTFERAQAQDDERLGAVSPERVQQVLRRLLRPDGWVVIVTGESGGQP